MEDLSAGAVKTGFALSRFLTPAEARDTAAHFTRRRDILLRFDGGYESAERVRAVFLHPDWGEYDRETAFAALKVVVPPQENVSLGHRDILGALMSLGINRNVIGDIIEAPPIILCLPELAGFITENLTRAGRARVEALPVALNTIPTREEHLSVKTDTVASARLDSVLAAAFDLSRGRALEYIESGRVSLDHEICLNVSKRVPEGAILSVRGLGRARLLELGGVSKKGRIRVKIGVYGFH